MTAGGRSVGARRWLLPAALCLLSLLGACDQAPPPDRLIEGRLFPALVLQGFDGERRPLHEYSGRVLVLNVWATWCPPCRAELPSLERLHARLDPDRFAVIGLSIDDDADIAEEFLLDRGVTFRNFHDPEGRIAREILEIRVYPDTFVISPDGVLLRKFVGEREWDDPALVEALEAAHRGEVRGLREW